MDIRIHIPTPREGLRFWGALLLAVASVVLVFGWGRGDPVLAAGNSITSPDTTGFTGLSPSLALDAAGNPVVAYHDSSAQDLNVMHCNDPLCFGGNESITAPDTTFFTDFPTSIVLDAEGNPVVSYHEGLSGDLNVLHCNDVNCAGNDESITAPDTAGDVGRWSSIRLDAVGNPVISYQDFTNQDLKVLHCTDVNCSGGVITSLDTLGNSGYYTSLALDATGNPVISYTDASGGGLKVIHCNDANCAGDNESISTPDAGTGGQYTSIALDSSGNPVVSYFASSTSDLKLMHCNDPNCAGGDESKTSPDTAGDVGQSTSLKLDASGKPLVSYYDITNQDLKVLHCDDVNCAPGGDASLSVDTTGNVGLHNSLALDKAQRPIVAYYDTTNSNLKLLHCSAPDCSGAKLPAHVNITNIGQYALPKSCFEVRDASQTPVFTVCDNDFAGEADANAACTGDSLCNDEDPELGSVSVTVAGADYRVVESTVAPEHTADTGKLLCNTTGGDCNLTFVNAPDIRPWHPWDLTSPTGQPDGLVRVMDILDVVAHFFIDKPLPTPTPTP